MGDSLEFGGGYLVFLENGFLLLDQFFVRKFATSMVFCKRAFRLRGLSGLFIKWRD